jgi:hypothetical protein
MRSINLSCNDLETIDPNAFTDLPFLEILNFNFNKPTLLFKNLNAEVFKNLDKLACLTLSHVGVIESEEDELDDYDKQTLCYTLKDKSMYKYINNKCFSLNLINNDIGKIDVNYFCDLTNLRSLDLSLNLIKQIEPKVKFNQLT